MNIKKTALAGLAVLVLFTAGCGGKKSENTAGNTAEAVVTPSPSPELQAEVTPTPAGVLVDMEKLEEPDEFETENYIGEKKDSSSSVLIINQTGDAIEHIFIRAAARDDGSSDEWGEELVHSFEWPDQEEAVYYYENNQLDLEGSTATSYDIRISYEDINRSELYYRNLPFPLIKGCASIYRVILEFLTHATLQRAATGSSAHFRKCAPGTDWMLMTLTLILMRKASQQVQPRVIQQSQQKNRKRQQRLKRKRL